MSWEVSRAGNRAMISAGNSVLRISSSINDICWELFTMICTGISVLEYVYWNQCTGFSVLDSVYWNQCTAGNSLLVT